MSVVYLLTDYDSAVPAEVPVAIVTSKDVAEAYANADVEHSWTLFNLDVLPADAKLLPLPSTDYNELLDSLEETKRRVLKTNQEIQRIK